MLSLLLPGLFFRERRVSTLGVASVHWLVRIIYLDGAGSE